MEGYQLSPQQKHLWSLAQLGELMPYTAQGAILIEGPVDREMLRTALRTLIERHEILRTTFGFLSNVTMPLQVVMSSDGELPIDFYDLSNLTEEAQQTRVEELLRDAAQHQHFPFDRAQVFLAEVLLAPQKHLLLVSMPAFYADAVAIKILMQDLANCYQAYLRREDQPEAPIQYVDLSEWQNESLEAEGSEIGFDYWRKQVANGTVPTLPFPRVVPQDTEFRPASYATRLERETLTALEETSTLQGSSLQTSLLASLFVVLSRFNSASELCLGVGLDGRNYDELSSALGLFARFVPINGNVQPGVTFTQLLGSLEGSLYGAQRWQELFTQSEPAFLPFCFEFIDSDTSSVSINDSLRFTLQHSSAYVTRFGVLLRCVRQNDGSLVSEWHYDSARYDEVEIARLAERWTTVLENIVERAGEVRIEELEVVGALEQAELLDQARGLEKEWTTSQCVHEIFAAQAAKNPATVAVDEGKSLTYGELDQWSNQLARYLRRLGVGPEECVGLVMERRLEMVVGLLGIWKAGAAYVPLDPGQPSERLARMATQAGIRVIVSVEEIRQQVDVLGNAVAVYLDTDSAEIRRESKAELPAIARPENLAYVIYTSGSTGTPKGVAVEHRQVANYLNSISQRLSLPARASYALVSTFAADLGNTVIFPALCTGGTLHVISSERTSDPGAFAEYFLEHAIDCLKIVPSHLSALMTHSEPEHVLPRKRLVLGGEASSWELVEKIKTLVPDCRVLNHYGPTETTVGVLTFDLENNSPESTTVPLGTPIANTQVYVLDAFLRAVPAGVAGELHIGGANVARGYLDSPEATASKFIPNPFSERGDERLYKTGDLARRLPDGSIEFLGRTDDQVKVRGFRVEPGEIETTINRYDGVEQVKVLARETAAGEKRLVAYVVARGDSESFVDELRAYLKLNLPDQMIPAAFVLLESMPLTTNGKIDRRALPDPAEANSEKTFVAPASDIEELLADIWRQVLRLSQIGVNDNFFELGGDSILSIQIVARANQAGLRLSPKLIFKHQTIAELARAVNERSPEDALAIAEQGLLTGPVPLTPVQHYFFEQVHTVREHFNQSLLLDVQRPLRAELLRSVVTALVEHHDALRLRYAESDQEWRQRYGGQETVAEAVVQVIEVTDTKQIEAVSNEIQRSMCLDDGGLLRVVLFQTGAEQRLLLAAHHLVVDGVSWRVLLEDLARGLDQAERGETINFGTKTSSYREWATRLDEYARGAEAASELDYWSNVERSGGWDLPVDHSDGDNSVESAQTISVSLDSEETRALLQEVPEVYRTQINDALLTALAEAVGKWTGRRQMLVQMEGHGREELWDDIDLSRTVGYFTSLFPVLIEMGPTNQGGALLKSVKEQLRRLPNRGLVYGLLRYLRKELSQGPRQPDLKFNYFGQLDNVLSSDSLFNLSSESRGAERDGKQQRSCLVEVSGAVSSGELQLNITYSENIHRRATMERLSSNLIEALRGIISHCRSVESNEFSPSDFPLANLSQQQLDMISKMYN